MEDIPADIPADIMKTAEATTDEISICFYTDAHGNMMSDRAEVIYCIASALLAERERWEDKVDGLESDLDSAVEVAFKRGATKWTMLNYPEKYVRLNASTKETQHEARDRRQMD